MSYNQNQNPFDPPQQLDSNPFDSSSAPHSQNPFTQANDSAFSLGSQDTERGGDSGSKPATSGSKWPNLWGGTGNQSGAGAAAGGGRGDPETGLGYDARQAQLDERERALRMREQQVNEQERELGMLRNNWPPFFPFLHHDISSLPTQHQTISKLLYTQWLALAATLIVNLLGCIFLLIAGSSEGGADTGAAGGYLPFIGVLSFILWYRPIYLGFKKTEGKAMAFFFYTYFIFGGFNLAFAIYMAIGIPSTGSAGLINTISMFSQGHILAAVFGVLASVGWILQAAGGGILYKRVWDYKNNNGDITFQEATNQFKHNSLKTIILHQARIS